MLLQKKIQKLTKFRNFSPNLEFLKNLQKFFFFRLSHMHSFFPKKSVNLAQSKKKLLLTHFQKILK